MTRSDLLCLALIALVLLLDHFVVWRAFLRRSRAEAGRARRWIYSALIVELWTLVAFVAVLWASEGRSWTALGLTAPRGWRLWASTSLVLAVAIALASAVVKIARLKRRKRIKAPGHAELFGPHSRPELLLWAAVALSAGFCEELIFRGYLLWVFRPMLGLWGAAALSLVVFAMAHAYQGAKSVLSVGIVGGTLTAMVILFGSLWPAIVVHLLVDLQQGVVAWLVFRDAGGGEGFTVLQA